MTAMKRLICAFKAQEMAQCAMVGLSEGALLLGRARRCRARSAAAALCQWILPAWPGPTAGKGSWHWCKGLPDSNTHCCCPLRLPSDSLLCLFPEELGSAGDLRLKVLSKPETQAEQRGFFHCTCKCRLSVL